MCSDLKRALLLNDKFLICCGFFAPRNMEHLLHIFPHETVCKRIQLDEKNRELKPLLSIIACLEISVTVSLGWRNKTNISSAPSGRPR